MRELIRQEVARPLNTDGLHLGRPPEEVADQGRADPHAAEQKCRPGVQLRRTQGCRLPLSGAFGAMYFPGSYPLCRGILRSWTGRSPRPTVW